MTALLLLASLSLVATGVLVRWRNWRTATGTDALVVDYHLKRMQRPLQTQSEIPNSLFPARDGYPTLLYAAAARLRGARKDLFLIAIVWLPDLITVMSIWLYVTWNGADTNSWASGVAVLVLVWANPLLTPSTSRVSAISGRPLALMLVTQTTFIWIVASDSATPPIWALAGTLASVVLVSLSLRTSIFGPQVLALNAFVLLLASGSVVPMVSMILAIAVMLLGGPANRDILRHHTYFKCWYWGNVASKTSASNRNDWGSLFRAVRLRNWNRLKHQATRANSWLVSVQGSSLYIVGVTAVLLAAFQSRPLPPLPLVFLMSGAIVAFITTSYGHFRSLGQAERYLEFGLPSVAALLLSGSLSQQTNRLLLIALILQTLVMLYQMPSESRKLASVTIRDYQNDLVQILKPLLLANPESRILVNPVKFNYAAATIIWEYFPESQASVYFRYAIRQGDHCYKYFTQDITDEFGMCNEALAQSPPLKLSERYSLNCFVLSKGAEEELRKLPSWRDFLDTSPPIFESDYWTVRSSTAG